MPIRVAKVWRVICGGGTALALALLVWSVVIEPAGLEVVHQRLPVPGWPARLGELRIAAIGDLHVGSPHKGLDSLGELVRQTNALHADLIVLLGDYVQETVGGETVPPEQVAQVLARLQAPLGVYAVLGNHDWLYGESEVRAAFADHGLRLLDETAVLLRHGEHEFWLAGFGDLWFGAPKAAHTLEPLSRGPPIIAITHNPDIFPTVPARAALVIAGHTHGGQVSVPGYGPPIVPSRFGQRYARGVVREKGHTLFVTSGVGTSILPLRFRVPPEIVILTVVPPE